MTASGKKIFQNTLILTSVELLTRILSLVLIMVVARKLGPEIMGVYAFGLAFIGIFQIFANFGLEPYIQREVSRKPEISGQLMAQIFGLKLSIFLLSVMVILVFGFTAVDNDLKRQVIWVLTGTMFFQINMVAANSFFRAHQKSKYEASVRMILRLVYTTAGIAAILSGRGLLVLVGIELVAQMSACFFAWGIFIKKIDTPFHRINFTQIKTLMLSTWNFFLIRLVQTIFNSIDLVMLSLMAGDLSTGYYSATVRLTGAFGFIPTAFTGAFFPVLSRKALESKEAFIDTFVPYYKFLLLIGVGTGAVIFGLSEEFVVLLFGPEFKPASTTLALMAIALILTFANWPISTAILALDKERQSVRVFAICAGANVVLNLGLIPLLKDQGAAWATIFSQILLMVLQCRILGFAMLKKAGMLRLSIRPIITGLATWSMIWVIYRVKPGLLFPLFAAGVVFLLSSLMTRSLKIDDLLMGKSFLFKGNK